jgi:hypothetical protein
VIWERCALHCVLLYLTVSFIFLRLLDWEILNREMGAPSIIFRQADVMDGSKAEGKGTFGHNTVH